MTPLPISIIQRSPSLRSTPRSRSPSPDLEIDSSSDGFIKINFKLIPSASEFLAEIDRLPPLPSFESKSKSKSAPPTSEDSKLLSKNEASPPTPSDTQDKATADTENTELSSISLPFLLARSNTNSPSASPLHPPREEESPKSSCNTHTPSWDSQFPSLSFKSDDSVWDSFHSAHSPTAQSQSPQQSNPSSSEEFRDVGECSVCDCYYSTTQKPSHHTGGEIVGVEEGCQHTNEEKCTVKCRCTCPTCKFRRELYDYGEKLACSEHCTCPSSSCTHPGFETCSECCTCTSRPGDGTRERDPRHRRAVDLPVFLPTSTQGHIRKGRRWRAMDLSSKHSLSNGTQIALEDEGSKGNDEGMREGGINKVPCDVSLMVPLCPDQDSLSKELSDEESMQGDDRSALSKPEDEEDEERSEMQNGSDENEEGQEREGEIDELGMAAAGVTIMIVMLMWMEHWQLVV